MVLRRPSVKSTPIEVPGTEAAKGRRSVRISRKHRNGVLTPSRYQMNEFTAQNEQVFLDACGAIRVDCALESLAGGNVLGEDHG
jgi:hypothetical protein